MSLTINRWCKMSDSKTTREGRPRVTLLQAVVRWVGDDKRRVERHIPEILDALYREMIEFEPVGLVTQAHLLRFSKQYFGEIRCLFANPFNGITTPEQKAAQRTDVVDYINLLKSAGVLPRRELEPENYNRALITAFDMRQAEMAYQQAHTHIWRLRGGVGTPPTQPSTDRSLMGKEELDCIDAARAACAARLERHRKADEEAEKQAAQARQPNPGPAPSPDARAGAEEAAEERPMLQAVEYGSPEDVLPADADRIDWPGKKHHESPRDMMRPYLTKIGRLDLLDGYSDEIIQYGAQVEYNIDGKWR